MKNYFVEPDIEVIRFFMEDTLTSSGFRTGGMNSGFDEIEPNIDPSNDPNDPTHWKMMPPCL